VISAFEKRHVDILARDVCTAPYLASCSVSASVVSATVRPPTDTTTRKEFASMVIG
jgi:hypothetical protein